LSEKREAFRHRLRVRYAECDPQGVVFNANYLTYFDVCMTELWRHLGGYDKMVAAGVDMVVAEANVRFLVGLRFDDEFDAVASVTRLGDTSMTMAIALERGGETVTEGEIRYVFLEPDGGAKAQIPEAIRSGLERYALGA
jgi:acyl-CoA thioester hydrolase